MDKVVSIYEARTNLSKYIKQAKAGKTIYVGAYGRPEAVIAPLPAKPKLHIGVWAHKKQLNAYDYDDLVGPDPDTHTMFNKSSDQEFAHDQGTN